ncbi:MAG: Hsp33 family molecular chaperone [Pseudomonadota bacterium]|jgi:Disulfide bond chaperones of the HSP33 family|nr:MAG: Hsp33 family molecular chaperone [Pseudomonadota bacterium]
MDAAVTPAGDDRVLPFAVEALDVRGRVASLGPSIDTIIARHAYPAPVSRVVGEAVVLTALLGSALKLDGRFQLQTRTDGPINMIVVDFDAPGRLRACARFDTARVEAAMAAGETTTGELLGHGHLALTIDQGGTMTRYQGVVALEGQSLEEAAHQYFRQSEQIPTLVRLAVGEAMGGGDHAWRAGGLMVQFLPRSSERMRREDLNPGDAPEGYEPAAGPGEDDAWTEAKFLVATVEDHELLDPTLTREQLLYRLFHERGVRVFEPLPVEESCRCSSDRILAMLKGFSPEDRADMVGDNGRIGITCEFCSRHYDIDPADVAAAADAG